MNRAFAVALALAIPAPLVFAQQPSRAPAKTNSAARTEAVSLARDRAQAALIAKDLGIV